MASLSYELKPGTEATSDGAGFFEDAITKSNAAPTTAGAVQLRIDLVNSPTREQVLQVLEAFERRIEGMRFGASDFGSI